MTIYYLSSLNKFPDVRIHVMPSLKSYGNCHATSLDGFRVQQRISNVLALVGTSNNLTHRISNHAISLGRI